MSVTASKCLTPIPTTITRAHGVIWVNVPDTAELDHRPSGSNGKTSADTDTVLRSGVLTLISQLHNAWSSQDQELHDRARKHIEDTIAKALTGYIEGGQLCVKYDSTKPFGRAPLAGSIVVTRRPYVFKLNDPTPLPLWTVNRTHAARVMYDPSRGKGGHVTYHTESSVVIMDEAEGSMVRYLTEQSKRIMTKRLVDRLGSLLERSKPSSEQLIPITDACLSNWKEWLNMLQEVETYWMSQDPGILSFNLHALARSESETRSLFEGKLRPRGCPTISIVFDE